MRRGKHTYRFLGGSLHGQVKELENSIFSLNWAIQVPVIDRPAVVYYGTPEEDLVETSYMLQLYYWYGAVNARGERLLQTDAPIPPSVRIPPRIPEPELGKYASGGRYARDLLRSPVS
jgi:hypothetical protein